MNTNGTNFIVGLFVIGGIIAIFIVGLWLARSDRTEKLIPYEIHFEESVSGLSVGSRVSYRGIRIGSVSDISIMDANPQFVRVIITIQQKYHIRQGDVAILKPEGITGSSYINIEGAQPGNEILSSTEANPAHIPSKKSEFERIVQGGPELISEATQLANRVSQVFDSGNRKQLNEIVTNINSLTSTLVKEEKNITTMLQSVNEISIELVVLSKSLNDLTQQMEPILAQASKTIANAENFFGKDGQRLIHEWEKSALSLQKVTHSAEKILTGNEESLNAFARDGLFEFSLFLQEARQLVAGMTRVVEQLEASGARFLLDQQNSEIEIE